MPKLSDFLNIAKGQISRGIYVWSLNGVRLDKLNELKIRECETSESNSKKAIKLWNERRFKYPDAIAADCSGFVVWCLIQCGAKKSGFDTTADGFLKKQCHEINKAELRNGDLCFKMTGTRATHVGIYCDGKVIEDRGRAYGIVSRSLSLGGWKKYGRLMINWDDEPKQYSLTRVLKKGCEGSDVKELQKKLISLGFSVGSRGADGEFGSKTKDGVVAFQRKNPVACGKGIIKNYDDGKVGKRTCEALGWIWRG